MLKRIVAFWAIANFVIVGLVSWLAGGWYLGWPVSPYVRMAAELGLIILPNLVLPILALRSGWPMPVVSLKEALGWQWNGWRSLITGVLAFVVFFALSKVIARSFGGSIPYNAPGADGESITIKGAADILILLAVLLGILAFVFITVIGEETMFRGWIQTQIGKCYGIWAGLLVGAILFGLRHLPADLFYARVWQATPQMWISRLLELYLGALCFGFARYIGKSTYASAIMHGMVLITAIFDLG